MILIKLMLLLFLPKSLLLLLLLLLSASSSLEFVIELFDSSRICVHYTLKGGGGAVYNEPNGMVYWY